jgi:hypothetical protein
MEVLNHNVHGIIIVGASMSYWEALKKNLHEVAKGKETMTNSIPYLKNEEMS